MGVIFDTAVEFFSQEGWSFEQIPNQPILRMGLQGKNGKWVGYAQAREEQDQFVFYSIFHGSVPAERRQAVAEFLTRANYGLVVGNFELDYRDGEVRYKTSIDVEGDELTPALVRNIVILNLQMLDRALPAIQAVLEGSLTPEQAAEWLENPNTPPS